MNTYSSKITAIFLLICMLFSLTACGTSEKEAEESLPENSIWITDMSGRKVAIPEETDKNTAASTYGVVSPLLLSIDMIDRMDAAAFKNKAFLRKAEPKIDEVDFIGYNTVDMEKLAAVNPSIFICKVGETEKIRAVTELGIPVITIKAETPEDIINTYELLGKAFGKEKEADRIIKYLTSEMETLKETAHKIPEDRRKSAVVIGTEMSRIAGDDMLQTVLLEAAGGVPVNKGINNKFAWVNIGTEKLLEMNPEYIFATSSGVLGYKLDDFYEDTAFGAMTAVKNKNIYKIPAKMDSWDLPGPVFILSAYYMMNKMYPDIFTDEDLQAEVDECYEFIYGRTFSADEIGY